MTKCAGVDEHEEVGGYSKYVGNNISDFMLISFRPVIPTYEDCLQWPTTMPHQFFVFRRPGSQFKFHFLTLFGKEMNLCPQNLPAAPIVSCAVWALGVSRVQDSLSFRVELVCWSPSQLSRTKLVSGGFH